MLKENFEIFGLKERDFFDSEDERVILSNSNGIYFRENENKDEFERGLAETKRDSLKDQEQNKENEENVKLKSVGDNNNELENKKISNDELKINELNINNNKSNINNIENKSNMNNIDNKLNIENDSSKEKSMSNKTDSNNSSTADRDQIRNLKKLIKKMRVKIDELLPKKEQYLAIYRLIEKRQSFVQRMIEFERMASDPKRLFKNSMQLINEEKFRKNAIPQLLKIESKIFYEIKEYENLFGDFLIENVPYKMVLADEIGNRIINKNIFIYNKETPRKKH
ncbi:hypothetical protein EQH57_0191 [Dictyocoela roeselum]|nr:hypothetical protein EQH57_0191 [Dictyocoela roeselum]